MTCQHDCNIQCFEDCVECSRYKLIKRCKACGEIVDNLYQAEIFNFAGYQSICFKCFMDKSVNTRLTDILLDFVTDAQKCEIMMDYREG